MLFYVAPIRFNTIYTYPQLSASKAASSANASEFDTTATAAASAAAAVAQAQPVVQPPWSSYDGRQEPAYGECEGREHYGFSNRWPIWIFY